uniref:Uncharacterized protein n=1 Tax=Vespula pensylvanica TaxID=30213 RepID=A0A834NXH9_VESPE|nr:hypothetical protein H0235_010627 [Vespula pensylvanica]
MQRNFFAREGVETLNNDDDDDDNDDDDDDDDEDDEDDEVDALWIYKSFISFVRELQDAGGIVGPRETCMNKLLENMYIGFSVYFVRAGKFLFVRAGRRSNSLEKFRIALYLPFLVKILIFMVLLPVEKLLFVHGNLPRESPTEVLPRKRCNHAVATTTTTTIITINCFRKLLHFLLRYVRNVRATLNVENASDSTLREKAGTGCVSFGASKNGRDPSDLIQQPYPPTKFSRHHSIGKGTDIQRGLLTSLSR